MFIILHDIFLDEYIRYTLLNNTSKIVKYLGMTCKDMRGAIFGNYPRKLSPEVHKFIFSLRK